jgi:signal transduction histidine kinase
LQHDIRAAATTIIWLASVLEAGTRDERERAHALVGIVECAHTIVGLAADDVTIRRVEPVAIGSVVRSAIERAQLTFPVTLELVDDTTSAHVEAAPLDITRVLDNLLANACRAADRGGSVSVHLSEDVDDVVIEIVDDGPGIDSAQAAGGLGLSIVAALVERLGGRCTVARIDEHGGTRALVELPRADATTPNLDTHGSPPP